MLVLGFGCMVLAVTMVPLVNLVVMPVAVIAGVLIWHQALKQHVRPPL
jgi:CysZ protein